jgi:predicted CXXCH cytochrome family protein
MTQLARPETVRGNFETDPLELGGKRYQLHRRGSEFWVELEDPDWALDPRNRNSSLTPRVSRRVGMLTGSHHMQVYWISSELAKNLQAPLPFTYLFDDQRWVPFNDTFLRDPNIKPDPNQWNFNCIECHATAGQPRPQPQLGRVDTRVAELGIACEACHGPAEEHVRKNSSNPLARYVSHYQAKGDPSIVNPARLKPKAASQICGQCHSIKWFPDAEDFRQQGMRYRPGQDLEKAMPVIQPTRIASGEPWVAGLRRSPTFLRDRFWRDGMVRISGRDYNGLIEAPCYKKGDLSCLSCHSMHQSQPVNQLAQAMDGNEACLQCHPKFRADVTAHTHHARDSSGSLCYNCHMPYTTYGLLKAIRSHYIESPSVSTTSRTGRPDGCNLCHLDRSLGWTDQHLVEWFKKQPSKLSLEEQTTSAVVLWALRGDAGQRALAAWHLGWEPARRVSGESWQAPFLAQLLADPYSAVRYIAGRSLRQLPGFHNFENDFVGTPDEQTRAKDRALAQWRKLAPDRFGPEILLETNGVLQQAQLTALLQQRDNSSMDLQE